MGEIILKMQGIQKYFPGVHALDDAQLEIRSGEVMSAYQVNIQVINALTSYLK